MDILHELNSRGLLNQSTGDIKELQTHLSIPRTVFCGFDPTADSLHIGSLLPIITLMRFQKLGHNIIGLIGGATGSIGDPSGKNTTRNKIGEIKLNSNSTSIFNQMLRLFNLNIKIVNNVDWLSSISVIDFMCNIGSHFSVNKMLTQSSVKSRIESESGISFQEFAYSLFQACDFAHLNKQLNCSVQIGGSDQWGNISAGIDLGHRMGLANMFGVTFPLLTKSDGTKFGKSESGNIWLDSNKTSIFDFYNFWVNVPDDDVERLLLMLTFISLENVCDIMLDHHRKPHLRIAQRTLARHLTILVHGELATETCVSIASKLFSTSDSKLTSSEFDMLILSELPTYVSQSHCVDLCHALSSLPSITSNGDSIRLLKQNSISVDGNIVNSRMVELDSNKQFFLLRKGKKEFVVINIKQENIND